MSNLKDLVTVIGALHYAQNYCGMAIGEPAFVKAKNASAKDMIVIELGGAYLSEPVSICAYSAEEACDKINEVSNTYMLCASKAHHILKQKDDEIEELKKQLALANAVQEGIQERSTRRM